MRPRSADSAAVAAVLRDMAAAVEAGDSLEGSIEYLCPGLEIDPVEYAQYDEKGQELYERVQDGDDVVYRRSEDAPDVMLLRGLYRIGNLNGQGGVRFLGIP